MAVFRNSSLKGGGLKSDYAIIIWILVFFRALQKCELSEFSHTICIYVLLTNAGDTQLNSAGNYGRRCNHFYIRINISNVF